VDILGRGYCIFLVLLFCTEVVEVRAGMRWMYWFGHFGLCSRAWRLVYEYTPGTGAYKGRIEQEELQSVLKQSNFNSSGTRLKDPHAMEMC
jgi:hypothetical protein